MADYGVKVSLHIETKGLRNQINEAVDGATKNQPITLRHFRAGADGAKSAVSSLRTAVNGILKSSPITITKINFQPDKSSISSLQKNLKESSLVIPIKSIDATTAVNKLRKQLTTMLSGLQIGGVKEFLGDTGRSDALKGATDAAAAQEKALRSASDEAARYKANLQQLKVLATSLSASGKNLLDLNDTDFVHGRLDEYTEYNRLIQTAIANHGNLSDAEMRAITEAVTGLRQKIKTQKDAEAAALKASKTSLTAEQAAAKAARESSNAKRDELNQTNRQLNLYKQIYTWTQNNTRAYKVHKAAIDSMLASLQGDRLDANGVKEISSAFKDVETASQRAGISGKSFFETFSAGLKKFGNWSIVTKVLLAASNTIRNMVTSVKELDAAMTELKKVTDLTSAGYTQFATTAAQTAKRIGATMADTVNATADFARLGYSVDDASALAEAALVYKNIGDGISDVTEATESIISTMQAFGYAAEDAMSIVDKFNAVGNQFAISSSGIGEALKRSASALFAAGNTIEESIGMIAATNEIIQNPDSVGTALKTLTMYLRAAKTEAEAAGIETDGMANSVSSLRDKVLGLTGIDIMIDDSTFKSTYQIIKEISEVWSSLSDTTQANLLNMLGGKRNANVLSALISNFDTAIDAAGVASNAFGSALAENEVYLDSIAGKMAIAQAAFEEFSSVFLKSDIVKFFYDLVTGVTEFCTALAKANVLIPSILVLLNSIKLGSAAWDVQSVFQQFVAVSNGGNNLAMAFEHVKNASLGFSDAQKKNLANLLLSKGLIQENQLAMMGLATATGTATTATGLFAKAGATVKAVFSSWNVIFMAITAVIGVVSSAIQKHQAAIQESIDKANEALDTFQTKAEEYKKNIKTLDDLDTEYGELSKGVDEFGESVSLTEEEYARYLSIVQQVADISPEMVSKYDDERRAILLYDDAIQTTIGDQEKLLANARDVLIAGGADSFKGWAEQYSTAINDIKNNLGDLVEDLDGSVWADFLPMDESRIGTWRAAMTEAGIYNTGTKLSPQIAYRDLYEKRAEFIEALKNTGEFEEQELITIDAQIRSLGAYIAKIDEAKASFASYLQEYFIDSEWYGTIDQEALDEYKTGLSNIINMFASYTDNISNATAYGEAFANMLKSVQAGNLLSIADEVNAGNLGKYAFYDNVTHDINALLGSNPTDIEVAAAAALRDYLYGLVDDYVESASGAEKEIANATASLSDVINGISDVLSFRKNAADPNTDILSLIEQAQKMADAYNELEPDKSYNWMSFFHGLGTENGLNSLQYNEDMLRSFTDAMVDSYFASDELKAKYPTLIEELKEYAYQAIESANATEVLTDTMSSVAKASDLITDIQKEITEIGYNSLDTLSSLIQLVGEDWANYVTFSGEGFTISTDALKEYFYSTIDALEVNETLKQTMKDSLSVMIEQASVVEKLTAEHKKLTSAIGNTPAHSDMMELTYDSYQELLDIDKRYASAVMYQNGILMLNRDAYNQVTNEIMQTTKAQAIADMQAVLTSDTYQDLISRQNELSDAEQQQLNDLNAEIIGYSVLVNELENATSAYQRFLRASDETTSGRYSAAENARQVIADTLENADSEIFGKVGREQYMAAIDFLIDPNIDVNTPAFDEALKTVDRYLQDGTEGINNFVDDLISHGFVNANQQLNGSVEDITKSLGISTELFRSMVDEYNLYMPEDKQIKVDWDIAEDDALTATEQLAALQEDVTNLNTSLDLDHDITVTTETAVSNIGKISSALSTVLTTIGKINKTKISPKYSLPLFSGGGFISGGGVSAANGTGFATGGKTLVGELGPEIVVDPTTNTWRTVGRNGAEFVNLPRGAIVFNSRQTKQLLHGGNTNSHGRAMADGSGLGSVFGLLGKAAGTIAKKITEVAGEAANGLVKTIKEHAVGEISHVGGNQEKSGGGSGGSAVPTTTEQIDALKTKYEELTSTLEHLIKHQEHLYKVAEHGLDFPGMEASLQEQVRIYKQIMANAQSAVREMIAAGADDTNEELQAMEETYWSAYDSMYDTLDKINALYVDAINAKIDGIQSAYSNLSTALKEFNDDGGISVDTFQSLVENGLEYLSCLEKIDGQYVINKESVNQLIAAETRQLAIEKAMAYVNQLKTALQDKDAEKVANLVDLSNNISDATWDNVFANAALLQTLGVTDEQYQTIIKNIQTMKDLSEGVSANIANDNEEVKKLHDEQTSALDKLLDYTKQLIKYETEEHIKAIEDEITAYKKIIDLKKESLQASKDEKEYAESVAEKTAAIAELQAKIALLGLDDSREAKAERTTLSAELADLQKDLSDLQSDHAYDLQVEALDKAAESYEQIRQPEIDDLESRLSSEEKLYQAALQRLNDGWSTIYQELIAWNTDAGNSLNSEITENWKLALQAVEEYGSYVAAVVARTGNPMTSPKVPVYHTGGTVGIGSAKDDEVVAMLQKGEIVVSNSQKSGLYKVIDFVQELGKRLGTTIRDIDLPFFAPSRQVAAIGGSGGAVVSGSSSFTFNPSIHVEIAHSGTMNETDARGFGKSIAATALGELQEAFERRGIGKIGNTRLKP